MLVIAYIRRSLTKMRPVKAALWRKIARRSEKIAKTFGSVENNAYLCTRI